MGRPKKEEGKRGKIINLRLTEEEFGQLLEMEKVFGLNRTDLLRKKLFPEGGRLVVNAKELILLLDGIGAEMGRAGNNINQLARHANQMANRGELNADVVLVFNRIMENYIGQQVSLERALRKIIRQLTSG